MAVFIAKGQAPLSVRQATKRGYQFLERELGAAGARPGDRDIFLSTPHANLPQRLLDILSRLPGAPASYSDYAAAWEADNETNGAHNLFNHQLFAYRKATVRLARYRLADGRPAQYEDQPTDDPEVTESVLVAEAIEPLPATVDQPTYDPEGTETVPNPLVVQDDAERTAAQAIVDGTPQEVKDFDV